MPVAIVSDSTCDLRPPEALSQGIDLVPILVRFGAAEYRDGVDLELADFYRRLDPAGELPTTAPPPADAFARTFKSHVDAGQEVICLTVSSKISQTYANAEAAAAGFSGQVHVVDTKSLSGGAALLATGAARLARSGADASAIRASIARWIASQHGFAAYPDLQFLAKSGRINKAQLLLGQLMHVVPIVRLDADGTLKAEANVKTFELAKAMVVDITVRRLEHPNRARIVVVHSHDPALAVYVEAELRKKLGATPKELTIHEAGPTIAANSGPGGIAVFTMEE